MRVLESSIERKVVAWCKEHCVLTTKQNGFGGRGKSDRIFWISGGRPLIMELKKPGEKPTKLQAYRMEVLSRLGYWTYWTDDAQVAIEILRRHVYERFESVRAVG